MASADVLAPSHRLHNVLDVLIVGGGPAGLSAALSLGRVLRSVALFDSKQYRNAPSSQAHNLPLHDGENPADIRRRMKEEIQQKYKTITFVEAGASTASEVDGIFHIVDTSGTTWKGRKLILATGKQDILPDIPGFKESWGKGILHCPFCRCFEEEAAGISRIGFLIANDISEGTIQEFVFYTQLLSHYIPQQTILLNGRATEPTHGKLAAIALSRGFRIEGRPIDSLESVGPMAQMMVKFSDGTTEFFDFVFHKPKSRLYGDLPAQLGLQLTDTGDIAVSSPLQQTSRKGVYAAGDCTTAVAQLAVTIGSGTSAGIGAVADIVSEDAAAIT